MPNTISYDRISDILPQLSEDDKKRLFFDLKTQFDRSGSPSGSSSGGGDELEISGLSGKQKAVIAKEQLTHFLSVRFEDGRPLIEYDKNKRPPTTLGRNVQGDHTIAYEVIFEIICSSIDNEDIEEIPGILVGIAKCFVAEVDYEKLDGLKAKHLKIIENSTIPREGRKKLTAGIRALLSSECQDFLVKNECPRKIKQAIEAVSGVSDQIVKDNLKNSENRLVMDAVREIAEVMMSLHQMEPLSAISKRRKALNNLSAASSGSGSEGSRVKEGMRDLKLINNFLKLKHEFFMAPDEGAKKSILLEYDKRFILIIKSAYPNTSDDLARKKYKHIFGDSGLIPDEDLDLTNVNNFHSIISGKIAIKGDLVGKLFNDLFDFEFVPENLSVGRSDAVLRQEYDQLINVASKYFVTVFLAFRKLGDLPSDSIDSILDSFSERLCSPPDNSSGKYKGGQGWSAYNSVAEGEVVNKKTIKDAILSKVEFGSGDNFISLKRASPEFPDQGVFVSQVTGLEPSSLEKTQE